MKDIAVPKEWAGRRIFVRFGGAGTVADLIVNGRYVGEHRGGYSAFTFDLTDYLKYGENNSLWVIVNNARGSTCFRPPGTSTFTGDCTAMSN